jgi:hypothetical protein
MVAYLPSTLLPLAVHDQLLELSFLAGGIAFIGLFRESLLEILELLWGKSGGLTEFRRRHGTLLILLFTALVMFETVIHFGQFGWIVVGIVALVGLRSFRELSRLLDESKSRQSAIDRDRLILLDQRNAQVFWTIILPILAVRLYGLLGAVCASQGGAAGDRWLEYGMIFAVAGLGLLALLPHPEHFILRCPRCSRRGSRVLRSLGGCPACAREEFQVRKNTDQPMSAERIFESSAEAPDTGESPRAASAEDSTKGVVRRIARALRNFSRSDGIEH